jgi:molybdopterin-dependent oxidoreductase alpha subunit
MDYRVRRSIGERLRDAAPLGIASRKPRHFRDMLSVAWRNRDNLGHAWRVLTRGVCDGCALGVAGLSDWTIPGVHLCMTRLNLLRLNTMPAMDPAVLADVAALRRLDNRGLRELGRLSHPMVRRAGERGFSRVSWDEATAQLAPRLRAAAPHRLAFFVTARGVTNEVYYVAQKAARFLGTNNVDNAARLCHAPSTGAMKRALGVAASTCSYTDWLESDLIVFWGANPANDQPVTTKYLLEAKRRGAKIVIVNPYLEPGMKRYWVPSSLGSALFGTALADWWFPVTQGGDIPFIYGVLSELIEQGGLDAGFIARNTAGWGDLEDAVRAADVPELERRSGLPREAFKAMADILRKAHKGVFVWSMGITQHTYGADGVAMVLNLGLARGYVGRAGTGLVPIRGHSSVQGGAEMGCYASALPGGKPVNADNAAALAAIYGFPIPDQAGLNAVEMVDASARGDLDVLYCVGGNFLRTLPDPDAAARALQRAPVRIHQDILVNDQMLLDPSGEVWLLPAQTRYEQEGGGIETSTERRIMFTPEIPRVVGEARAEWRILRNLAAAARPEIAHLLGCESGPAIRAEIAKVVPFYAGCETLSKTGDAVQYGGRRLCDDGAFQTPDGKAHFAVIPIPNRAVADDPEGAGRFILSTRRGKQFNTLIYADVDPLNGAPRDAVLISPVDASRLGLAKGDRVRLVNKSGAFEASIFPAPIAPGNVQVHWPEANHLLPAGVTDPDGGVPDYNTWVRIERPVAARG